MAGSTGDQVAKAVETAENVKDAVAQGSQKATSDLAKSVRAFVSGGVGGVCAVLTGHPFDLVKVHLQTAEKGVYNGAIDVARKIVMKNGPTVRLFSRQPCFCRRLWIFLMSTGSLCWCYRPTVRSNSHV